MVLFIFKLCVIFLSLILIHINLTRYIHIFQLTFYNFTEFFPTTKKNKEYSLGAAQITLLIIMFIASLFNFEFLLVIWMVAILIIMYYTNLFKPKEKKKFVKTMRVKIIYAISYLVVVIFVMIPLVYLAYKDTVIFYFLSLFIALYKYTSIFLACIGNLFTKPIMKIFNSKYIKEAKDIISKSTDMKIIGITGSYGKTSTKNIINDIICECFSTVMTPKSFNTTLGVTKCIREDIKPYTEVFICEMGAARVGEIKEICDIVKPDYSIITSIGPQHLTSFKTMENIQKGKFEIVQNSKENSISILNVDNEYIKEGIGLYANDKKVITYAINNIENADYYATNIKMTDEGSTFDVMNKNEILHIETKLLGKHNVYNILCAIIIAKNLNIDNDKIILSIKKVKPIEHRLQLKTMDNILALDDSFNSNPEGSKAAIECLNMFNDKYKVLVTPGMIELGDKEYELNKKLGKYASSCDFVILVGSKTTKALQDGLEESKFKNYVIVKDIYEAFNKLNKLKIEHNNLIALFENDLPDSYS